MRGPEVEGLLTRRGLLATSGDIFCHRRGTAGWERGVREEGWSWRWWGEARNAAKHPTIARDGRTDKGLHSLKRGGVALERSAYAFSLTAQSARIVVGTKVAYRVGQRFLEAAGDSKAAHASGFVCARALPLLREPPSPRSVSTTHGKSPQTQQQQLTASSRSLALSSMTERRGQTSSSSPQRGATPPPPRRRRMRRRRRLAGAPRGDPRPPGALRRAPGTGVRVPRRHRQRAPAGEEAPPAQPGAEQRSRHLLVQNEVQVESPVAGWTPFLAAAPVPGAEQHEGGPGETSEAGAQGALLGAGHDPPPAEGTRRPPPSHAPGLARTLRGAPCPGPSSRALYPPRAPETARKQLSGGVQGFPSGFRFGSVSRSQVSRIPILSRAFFF